MADSDKRNIYGVAITVAYTRAYSYGSSVAHRMCQGFAKGFGMSETDGDDIYSYFSNESHPESVTTFSEAPYSSYEAEVIELLSNSGLGLDGNAYALLGIAAQAMLFAYSLNAAIELYDFQKLIGSVLKEVALSVLGVSVFKSTEGDNPVVITPFLSTELVQGYMTYDYGITINDLTKYPRLIDAQMVNYNWYDTARILHGPDLQIMRDVENQYYYLSGVLRYESMLGTLDTCIEDEATISTWTGDATFSYVRNPPCLKADTYVGPVSYLTFNRIFNDGPTSSGYFDTGVVGFYIDNDRAMLETGDWASNSHVLSGVTGEILTAASVFTDSNGRYDLANGEYNAVPMTWDCEVPYQSMHIGDNRARVICSPPPATCASCQTVDITGFKYASLEVPFEDWSFSLQFRQTNPLSETGRIYKRAWAISDNPYVATAKDGYLWPYTYTEDPYQEFWYCGFPTLNGTNELCQLGFFHTMLNSTFPSSPSIVIYPVIAKANGESSEGGGSSRTYEFGSGFLFSGRGNNVPVEISSKISANLSGCDILTQKFFGMGNAFSGQYDITVTEEENAGFMYTGFSVTSGESKTILNARTLADAYSGKIIGKYKTMKYISGYRSLIDGTEYTPINKYGIDMSGNYYTFAYFDTGDAPLTVATHNWPYWCPVPSVFEAGGFDRVYAEQTVESYLPRYYDGPFSVETRTFLYPNARAADLLYAGKTLGVPYTVTFRVNVREETVRELYGRYTIFADGNITTYPTYRPVIRPDVMGFRETNPRMTQIFKPNDSNASFDYNFNLWEVDYGEETGRYISTSCPMFAEGDPEWVDNAWAPLFDDDWVPSGRNNVTFNGTQTAESLFTRGYKKTSSRQTHAKLKAGDEYDEYYSEKPVNAGLFHAYRGVALTGQLTYVLPMFNLTTNALELSRGYSGACSLITETLSSHYVTKEDGREFTISTGLDPMFFEYMGGRRGSISASQEGGYNEYGFVGDRWMGVVYAQLGSRILSCYDGGDRWPEYLWRTPRYDSIFLVFNTDINGTDLWCNGFRYNPMYQNRPTGRMDPATLIPYETDAERNTIVPIASGEFLNFNITPFFAPRVRTGMHWYDDEWYYSSGFFIGPFDRDVEVGIADSQEISALSDLYVNDEQLSHRFYDDIDCDRQFGIGVGKGRTVTPGGPYYNKRNAGYSIITVIRSGHRAKFNVKAVSPQIPEDPGDMGLDYVGMLGNTYLSLKTHVPLYGNSYDSRLHSGESTWLDKRYLTGPTYPFKLRLAHDGLNMGGIYEFTVFSRSGKVYPKPDPTEFAALASYDVYGNPTYPAGVTVESYWRNYAIAHKQNVIFSGWREGSRVSFEILDIKISYDVPPYQSYQLVVPSGNCTLSGKMGYYGQADNCIFTEGVHLVNATLNDEFADVYNPQYVSDVLSRFTGIGLFSWPTGIDDAAPVLKAPSVMKQREIELVIDANQNYVYLQRQAPYNYNKLLWPAFSDLETMNPGETMEALPPGDGITFPNSTMMFSASQGQELPNGASNPNIVKSYYVQDIFQIYDSVSTDAYINSGKCITSGRGTSVLLTQTELSGALVPNGTPLAFVTQGLV